MKSKYLTIVAALAVMLVATTALVTTDSALAGGHGHKHKKSYETNHVVSNVNGCGNGEAPLNVWCKNRASQLPDGQNEVGSASNQGFSESPRNPNS
ncbi:MAG: hypothetical protein WBL68_12810 [Nitrososphaeraceae archaeon]